VNVTTPNSSARREETFKQNQGNRFTDAEWGLAQKLSLQLQDPHDARAWEFTYLQQFDKAFWVERCSNSMDPLGGRTCKLRLCPTCAVRASRHLAGRIHDVARQLHAPLAIIMSLRSLHLGDLRSTLRDLRQLLARVHRWKGLGGLRGVGAVEPKLTADGRAWNAHAHLLVETKSLNIQPLAERYRGLTNGLGTLTLAVPRPDLCQSIPSIAVYFAKPESWCPVPGSMHPLLFGIFADGVKGAQRLVEWNVGRRGRRKAPQSTGGIDAT
jgi:hypothetical protein